MEEVQPDESRRARHVAHEAAVGVVNIRTSSRSANRGRYYGQPEWAAYTRRRMAKHLDSFDSHREFVEFAIQAAHDRKLEAPNHKKSQTNQAWDVDRIVHVLADFMRGTNSGSKTLQFFNAALDELEGIGASRSGAPIAMPGHEASMRDDEVEIPPVVEPDIIEVDEEEDPAWREEALQRYVSVLIGMIEDDRHWDEAADRIERILL